MLAAAKPLDPSVNASSRPISAPRAISAETFGMSGVKSVTQPMERCVT
jgi:hypothetical protein